MEVIKEIILFTYGDSKKASTWSNVPYLMAKHFEQNGIIVNRVDISVNNFISKCYNKVLRLLPKFYVGKDYQFVRTPLMRWMVNRTIKKAVNAYPNSDFCVFLSFDYVNKYKGIPTLIFSDWTYRILIEEREKRTPAICEKRYMRYQDSIINSADIVLPLFSNTYHKMRSTYPTANVKSIDFNVINNMCESPLSEEEILQKKQQSDYVLFIGRVQYKEGLKALIETLQDNSSNRYKVHVIGMDKTSFPDAPDSVIFHGFLRKDVPNENHLYYQLIQGAKIMINPTPIWGGVFIPG
jgi:glycosyltransferase involved in cell wall biosynthesis